MEKLDWHAEANAVIKDVKDHVKRIEISEKLVTDGSCIFINVSQTTKVPSLIFY